MHHVLTIVGCLLACCAGLLVLLGVLSWPPGGLMFALPYVLFFAGAGLGSLAAVLIWLGRRLRRRAREQRA